MLAACAGIAAGLSAACWIPLIFSGSWTEWLKFIWTAAAAALSTFMAVLLIKAFIETLYLAPKKLAAQLSAMPEQERAGVIAAYPEAKQLGERWFMPEHILFYTQRRAIILRYDAIKTVSPQDGDLRLGSSAGDIVMPVKSGENAGIIFALLRSRNPELKADLEPSGDKTENSEKDKQQS